MHRLINARSVPNKIHSLVKPKAKAKAVNDNKLKAVPSVSLSPAFGVIKPIIKNIKPAYYELPIKSAENPLPHDIYLFLEKTMTFNGAVVNNLRNDISAIVYDDRNLKFYIGFGNGELYVSDKNSFYSQDMIFIGKFLGGITCLCLHKDENGKPLRLFIGGLFISCDMINSTINCYKIAQVILNGSYIVRPVIFTDGTDDYLGFDNEVTCITSGFTDLNGLQDSKPTIYFGGKFTALQNDSGISTETYLKFATLDLTENTIYALNNQVDTGFDGDIYSITVKSNINVTDISIICVVGEYANIIKDSTTTIKLEYCSVLTLGYNYNVTDVYPVGVSGDITSPDITVTEANGDFYISGEFISCKNSKIVLGPTPTPLVQAFTKISQASSAGPALIQYNYLEKAMYLFWYDMSNNMSYIQKNNTNATTGLINLTGTFFGSFAGQILKEGIINDTNFKLYIYGDYTDNVCNMNYTAFKQIINESSKIFLPKNRGIQTHHGPTIFPAKNKRLLIWLSNSPSDVANECIHLFYDGKIYRIVSRDTYIMYASE
jgi:hypothetical protein